MIVLISHLMLPIEWVPSPQKEYGYYKITQDNKPCITPARHSVKQVGVNLTISIAKHLSFKSPYKYNFAT